MFDVTVAKVAANERVGTGLAWGEDTVAKVAANERVGTGLAWGEDHGLTCDLQLQVAGWLVVGGSKQADSGDAALQDIGDFTV